MARILIVDAEPARLRILDLCLQGAGHLVTCVPDLKEATGALGKACRYDLVILGETIRVEVVSGLVAGMPVRPALVRLLTIRPELGSERMLELTQGFDDYLQSPLNVTQVHLTVDRALNHCRRSQQTEIIRFADMLGASATMQQVLVRLLKAANNDDPVLLEGEFGVGKTLAAIQIHRHSRRRTGAFEVLQCGEWGAQDLQSQVLQPDGLLGQLDGGAVYLQGVDQLPRSLQLKLAEWVAAPMGSLRSRPGRPNVRFLAAAERPLPLALSQRHLVPELYYRLSLNSIEIPPLRQRALDIPELAHFFLGESGIQIAGDALEMLMNYDWPGNVAELRNVVSAAANACDEKRIEVHDLPSDLVQVAQRAAIKHRYMPGAAEFVGSLVKPD